MVPASTIAPGTPCGDIDPDAENTDATDEAAEPAPLGIYVSESLAHILLTIRMLESGNNYTIGKNGGGASGAYQYIDSTWGNYRGYPSAYLAPAWVQDERAAQHVQGILDAWGGDISMVPIIWYFPRAASDPSLMDTVPMPWAGNRLTIREYQLRWVRMFQSVSGKAIPVGIMGDLELDPRFLTGRPPEIDLSSGLALSYPVLGPSSVAPPPACSTNECEPGTDAIVFGHQMQPILVAADGVVTDVTDGPITGRAVTVTDVAGRTYRYSGFNDDTPGTDDSAAHPAHTVTSLATVGTTVRAGQIIGFMGNTDPMPGSEHRRDDVEIIPHVRLQIRDASGVRLDADRLVAAAQISQSCHVGIGPWSMPADDRLGVSLVALKPVTIDWLDGAVYDVGSSATDAAHAVIADIEPSLTIASDGTVIAAGSAALIPGVAGCDWAPDVAHGPGAEGETPDDSWYDEIDLPAWAWVSMGSAATAPALPRLGR